MVVADSESTPPGRSIYGEILKGSGLYSLPLMAQRLVGFILLPIYTRYLTTADYGIIELLDQAVGLVTLLLGANFSAALSYFYFQNESENWRKRTVGTTILGSLLLGLACAALGISTAGLLSRAVFGTPENAYYFRILFAGVAVTFPLEAACSWLRTVNAAGLFALTSIVRLILTAGLTTVLLIGAGWRVTAVLSSSPIVTAFCAVLLLAFCRVRLGRFRFDRELFGKLFRYTAPMALTGLAFFVLHFGDRFVLKSFTSLEQVGIYALGYKIGMLVSIAHGTFNSYWSSQVYRILKLPDGNSVFTRVFTYMNLFLLFLVVGITVFARPATQILTTPAFYDAAALAPVIAGAYYFRAVGDFFRVIFYVQGRPGVDAAVNWIGAIVCAVCYFAFIPLWGVWGAAAATLIAFLLLLLILAWWAFRMMPFRLEGSRLTKLAIAATVPLAISYVVRPDELLRQIGLGTALALLFPTLLFVFRFPTPGEWIRVRGLLRL